MTRSRGMIVAAALAVLTGSASWGLRAQGPPEPNHVGEPRKGRISVEEAMTRPFDMPFVNETTLEDVVAHLKKALDAPVALDRAALRRQDLTPQSTVQLRLEGVRLKTGMKLLLDQVGLTAKVVSEDNLLVLTDSVGAGDPTDRIFAELHSLHRDVHTLQDLVEDLGRDLAPIDAGGPAVRKPTMIDEMPDDGDKPRDKDERPSGRTKPGSHIATKRARSYRPRSSSRPRVVRGSGAVWPARPTPPSH